MKAFHIKILVALLFILLFVTSCQTNIPPSTPTPTKTNSTNLVGTRWTLQLLNGHTLLENTVITSIFKADAMNGSSGCNFYETKYAVHSKNGFAMDSGALTAMACPALGGIMEQESEYIETFAHITRYQVENKTLSLANNDGKILLQYQLLPKFNVNAKNLIGKTWKLVSATGLETTTLDAFTLQFAENDIHGTTICRKFKSTYQTTDDSLNITSIEMERDVACSEKDQIVEGNYITLFGNVWQYNLTETQLELYTIKGGKLVFALSSQK